MMIEFGEQCLTAWIDCFDYNVHLVKIIWRLNSRQSFKITKLISRNIEIQKKIALNKECDELLPPNAVGVTRSQPKEENN